MNCIAIETSTNICSVALFREKKIINIKEINKPRSHSTELGIMINNLLEQSKVEIEILDFIALSSGPGSFTGLRIGSSLAKGIAYSLGIPIVMVPTLNYHLPVIDKLDRIIDENPSRIGKKFIKIDVNKPDMTP